MKAVIYFPANPYDKPCHPCNDLFTHSEFVPVLEQQVSDDHDIKVCEDLFRFCQNHNDDYVRHHLRSLSVGDIIGIDDKFYQCEGSDWSETHLEEIDSDLFMIIEFEDGD